MTINVQNPHDRFFRRTFGDVELAAEFLKEYLPPAMRDKLDLSTLHKSDTILVDEELAQHQSDTLYEVGLVDSSEKVFVYILIEHKSYPDRWALLQLLRYMLKLWQQEVDAGAKQLRPILPILIYHGEVVWPYGDQFADYFGEGDVWGEYLPRFTAVVKDFSAGSDEEIRGLLRLQAVLLALRRILDRNLPDHFESFIGTIFRISEDERGLRLLELILYYFTVATDKISPETLQETLALQDAQGEKVMQTIAEVFREEGRKEGREEGFEEGREENARQSVYDILEKRFGRVPEPVEDMLEETHDLERLRHSVVQAALTESIEAFEQWLDQQPIPPHD